jgi:hypothetical protein
VRVFQTKLSSHFEVTAHCFSVVVLLYVIQCKHCAKETKSIKKQWEVCSELEYIYIFSRCVLAGLCILLTLIPISC